MGKIKVLPDHVANQIAAGEVVERPASIVKELIENSIDAGSTSIRVEFKKGGANLIRIEDDGCGMSQDDALLSLERHATSKITSAKDLDKLTSMGFRGEAIPSIASVSKFVLQSREAESESGTEILINGGKLAYCRECGMPPGTRITISQLFNSVPARRKFLKSEATESAHIVHTTRLYALAHPEVAFSLSDGNRFIFRTPACSGLKDRVSEIFGKGTVGHLIDVDALEGDLRIWGLIGAPGHSRSSRHEMLMFVNGRPVESRTLGYALIESYYGHIPKGRYPVAFLFLEIPPEQVDINVHPAKREIRFRQEASVRGFAVRSILKSLRSSVEIAAAPVELELRKPKTVSGRRAEPPSALPPKKALVDTKARLGKSGLSEKGSADEAANKVNGDSIASPHPPAQVGNDDLQSHATVPRSVRRWRFIGWGQSEYALFDTDNGIVMLDTVSVERRVVYERILKEIENRSAAIQSLLLPIPVEFDPVSAAVLADNAEMLETFGLSAQLFGRNFFRIEGIPSWLPEGEAESYLRDIVALLRKGGISDKNRSSSAEAIALKSVARLLVDRESLSEAELQSLIDQLFETRNPLTDPQGRPTFIEISNSELRRRFHRTPSR
jgi:DNA mismatch repair protein MutL